MIWGKTTARKERDRRELIETVMRKIAEHHTGDVFLWIPRKLEDGRWAWLETVYRQQTFYPRTRKLEQSNRMFAEYWPPSLGSVQYYGKGQP